MNRKDFKKFFTIFYRSGQSISRIIQTNIPEGYKNHLPFYEGMHTVKLNDNPDLELNPGKPVAIDFRPENIFKGYIDVDGKALHFVGKHKKAVKTITRSFYHAVADDLAEIVNIITMSPKTEIIFNISDIAELLDNPEWDLMKYFFSRLDEEKVKYSIVDFSKFDVIYIDNFSILTFPFHSGARLDLLADFLKKGIDQGNMAATRKVFVSRKNTRTVEHNPDAVNFSYPNDRRIDDHEALENIFRDLGFEIVYAESISSFKEQIRFFLSVKVLAGVTGSGLTNAIFLPEGSTLVEITTPLITQSPLMATSYFRDNDIDPKTMALDPNLVQEIHMFYHNLAFFKNLSYLSIPNFTRSTDKLKEFIENDQSLKRFLINEQSNNI